MLQITYIYYCIHNTNDVHIKYSKKYIQRQIIMKLQHLKYNFIVFLIVYIWDLKQQVQKIQGCFP